MTKSFETRLQEHGYPVEGITPQPIAQEHWIRTLKGLILDYHPDEGGDLHRDLRLCVQDFEAWESGTRTTREVAREVATVLEAPVVVTVLEVPGGEK